MPTAEGPCRCGSRAAAAALPDWDCRCRGRRRGHARLQAAHRFAQRLDTSRRALSRGSRLAGRPQRTNVATCVILTDFRRAAARVKRRLRGAGGRQRPSYVVNSKLRHTSEAWGSTVIRCCPIRGKPVPRCKSAL